MNPLDLTGLSPIMASSIGIPDITIGLIDGPVAESHPDLTSESLRFIADRPSINRTSPGSAAKHGTFIAGILNAKRSSPAPAICPGCTLLIRPVFSEDQSDTGKLPGATPFELASAITECIDNGARLINLSIALERPSLNGDPELHNVLDYAGRKGVIVVVAAGNQGILSGSVLTRHPWVIPVVSCDLRGSRAAYSNITVSIRRNGLMAPGEKITSLGIDGQGVRSSGTSAATPFVSGAIALLWSKFPDLSAAEIKNAIIPMSIRQNNSVSPPLLNAWEALQRITHSRHEFINMVA